MAEMSHKYRVTFAHDNDRQENEDIRHGWGTVEIVTDRPVESDEQRLEVARSIGNTYGFTKVGVMSIDPVE